MLGTSASFLFVSPPPPLLPGGRSRPHAQAKPSQRPRAGVRKMPALALVPPGHQLRINCPAPTS